MSDRDKDGVEISGGAYVPDVEEMGEAKKNSDVSTPDGRGRGAEALPVGRVHWNYSYLPEEPPNPPERMILYKDGTQGQRLYLNRLISSDYDSWTHHSHPDPNGKEGVDFIYDGPLPDEFSANKSLQDLSRERRIHLSEVCTRDEDAINSKTIGHINPQSADRFNKLNGWTDRPVDISKVNPLFADAIGGAGGHVWSDADFPTPEEVKLKETMAFKPSHISDVDWINMTPFQREQALVESSQKTEGLGKPNFDQPSRFSRFIADAQSRQNQQANGADLIRTGVIRSFAEHEFLQQQSERETRTAYIANKLHQTVDAYVWADEFVNTWHLHGPLDRDTVMGWFANAFVTATDLNMPKIKEAWLMEERARVRKVQEEEWTTQWGQFKLWLQSLFVPTSIIFCCPGCGVSSVRKGTKKFGQTVSFHCARCAAFTELTWRGDRYDLNFRMKG